jgi:hypothetical protein
MTLLDSVEELLAGVAEGYSGRHRTSVGRLARRRGGPARLASDAASVGSATAFVCWAVFEEGVDERPSKTVSLGHRVDAHAGVIIEPALCRLGGSEEVDMVTEGRSHTGLLDRADDRHDSGFWVGAGDPGRFDSDSNGCAGAVAGGVDPC